MTTVKTKALGKAARTKTARRAGAGAAKSRAGRKVAARAAKQKTSGLVEQAREQVGLEERAAELAERAAELADRVRESEAFARAQARGTQLAGRARELLRESDLDERAAELAQRMRTSEAAQHAKATAQRVSDEQLSRLGGWLSQGKAAEKLGVQPAKGRRSRALLLVLLGVGVGYLVGILTAPRRGEDLRTELLEAGGELKDDLAETAHRAQQDTADMAAPAAQKPIADEVRTRLGEDPRTADLPKLNVNVAEGTVFVRGSVPADFDEDAIREVVASVPGVEDVDLQLTASA